MNPETTVLDKSAADYVSASLQKLAERRRPSLPHGEIALAAIIVAARENGYTVGDLEMTPAAIVNYAVKYNECLHGGENCKVFSRIVNELETLVNPDKKGKSK